MYAQTNIQLFNQLRHDGYANIALSLIRDAYELAMQLYSGYFIGSGRTQIAHNVGTASILGALHLPAEVIAAGLIHNVYDNGDFGDGRRGASKARRRQIRQALGVTVEEYVYRFPAVRQVVISFSTALSSQIISTARKRLDTLDPVDRQVLLIVLAEQLDHGLSHEYTNRNPLRMREVAEQVGFSTLATELEQAFSTPAVPLTGEALNRSGIIIPRSYRRRLWIILRPKLSHSLSQMRSALNIRRWLHHVR
jgi:(p)ppGpp synthase/HD superfamily hydrolase